MLFRYKKEVITRKEGRKQMQKVKKTLLTLVCAGALVVGSVAATVAYLTDTTDTVTNTFTVGKVDIDLTETPNQGTTWSAKLIPGESYAKDPVVTVKADSERCWLFVMFDEVNNPKTYLDYTSNLSDGNGWTQGDGVDIPKKVWYREVGTSADNQSWYLLAGVGDGDYKNGYVTVKSTLKSDGMPAADKAPSLTYTAYAVQYENLTAAQAWAEVAPTV